MADLGLQPRGEVETQLQRLSFLAQPQLLLRGRDRQLRGGVGGQQEGRGPGTADVVDGLQLVLDVVDQR